MCINVFNWNPLAHWVVEKPRREFEVFADVFRRCRKCEIASFVILLVALLCENPVFLCLPRSL